MVGCQHCKEFAVEMAEIRTIVTRMDRELLGDGQQTGRIAAQSVRIGRLERWRSWMTGALAAVGAFVGAATTLGAAILSRTIKP